MIDNNDCINNMEVNFIKNIQKIPRNDVKWFTKLMSMTSAPFHTNLYVIIILILYFFKKISSLQISIICLSQLIIFCIKNIFKRKRPFESNNIKLLEPMIFDQYSFPSGHTLNAFLLSYILKKNNIIDLNIIPYCVGLSRIFLGVHYPTDVIGGFLLSKIIIMFLLKST